MIEDLSGSYIWMTFDSGHRTEYGMIHRDLGPFLREAPHKFSSQFHLTLNYLWEIKEDHWIQNLSIARDKLSPNAIEDAKNLRLWKCESFVSDKSWKLIVYVSIEWGELFFQELRNLGYGVNVPHMSIVEIDDPNFPGLAKMLDFMNNNEDFKERISILNMALVRHKLFLVAKFPWVKSVMWMTARRLIEILAL